MAVTGVVVGDPLRLLVPCGGMRTAPNVAAGATRAALDGGPGASSSEIETAVLGAAADVRRPIAAALLLTAAVALFGGAAVGRRSPPDSEPPDDAPEPADMTETPTQLTLVRVPRESGP